jgi:hypothetical protein
MLPYFSRGRLGHAGHTLMHFIRQVALAALILFAVIAVPATGADIELPGIVVTGHVTKPPDIVSRDRAERSPDIHWPPDLPLRWSEMFGKYFTSTINAGWKG